MIYLLLGLGIGLIILGVVGLTRTKTWDDGSGWVAPFVLGILCTFPLLIIIPGYIFANGSGLMKWQAFYEANSRNYEIAVDETASYLSTEKLIEQALIPIDGSIEKMKLADSVSTRILEWRNAVNRYNNTISSMKYFNRNIFTGVLVPNEVEDMKLLIIQ
ncbi:hypothetical protein LCGC14_1115590 [marine sediment metagenome]|uniref:Uncharacterized protein n=1 Tax=marine sediment metagenome TaxID=412755 RepID=A0A0F9MA78_9ZZZZ